MRLSPFLAASAALGLGACAHLDFGSGVSDEGVTFYDPAPFLVVSYDKECAASASVITLPNAARPRHVIPRSGYGQAELNATFSNGMIASFGQKTDTKIPETIPQAISLLGALGVRAEPREGCKPGMKPELYRIVQAENGGVALVRVTVP